MKTKQELAAYITQCQKEVLEFEKRAWLLLAMWNATRNQETFLAMVLAHWLDVKQELAKPPDEFQEVHLRDEKVITTILTYMCIDPTSITQEGNQILYTFF